MRWTKRAICAQLLEINKKLEQIVTAQQDIDSATAALTALITDVANNVAQLGTDIAAIQAEIQSLQALGVNTAALAAAVSAAASTAFSLDTAVSGVTALTAPPVPAPAPPSSGS